MTCNFCHDFIIQLEQICYLRVPAGLVCRPPLSPSLFLEGAARDDNSSVLTLALDLQADGEHEIPIPHN